jgi:WD40 repeat protein
LPVPVVISGHPDGTLRAWAVEDGRLLAERDGHDGRVTAIATGDLGCTPCAISAGTDGTVRTWRLPELTPSGPALIVERGTGLSAVATCSRQGRTVVAAAALDRLQLWDPVEDVVLRVLEGHTEEVALAEVGERLVVARGEVEGGILVEEVMTDRVVARIPGAHEGGIGALATTRLRGRPTLVSGGASDGRILRWDLSTGMPLGPPSIGHHGPLDAPGRIWTIATGELAGQAVAVSSGWDGELWVWDLSSGERVDTPLDDYLGEVHTARFVEVDGGPGLAAGGEEEPALRVWDLRRRTPSRVIPTASPISAMAVATLAGGPERGTH